MLEDPSRVLVHGVATRLNTHCRSPSSTSSWYLVAQFRIAATSCAVGLRVCAAAGCANSPGKTTTNPSKTRTLIPFSPRLFEDFAPDQHAADFAGAGADLVKLRIAQKPAGRIVIDITVAPQTLDRFERHPGGALRGIKDGAGSILTRRLPVVASSGDRVDVSLRGIERHIHVGELGLHELETADRLTELRALMQVGNDEIEAGLHDTERACGQHGAFVIQAGHQHIDAIADDPEHVIRRHLAIGENDLAGIGAAHAELVELLAGRESLGRVLDNE